MTRWRPTPPCFFCTRCLLLGVPQAKVRGLRPRGQLYDYIYCVNPLLDFEKFRLFSVFFTSLPSSLSFSTESSNGFHFVTSFQLSTARAQEASELILCYGNNCSPQQQEYEARLRRRALSVASKERRKMQHTAKLFLNGIKESFFNLLILFTKRPVNVSRVAAIIRLG